MNLVDTHDVAISEAGAAGPYPSVATDPLVRITSLSKSFGRRTVLHDIDLTIARRTVTAIIGPNGSGKTTLNKSLLGLVRPDHGVITFDGTAIGTAIGDDIAYRARIGYMPQAARFPETMSARDVLRLLTELRGAGGPRDEELIGALALAEFLDQPVRVLSGGQRQRLNAAAAFLFRPDLLLLDEPTAGLDPLASGVLKDKLLAVRDEGRTVVITSHILSELQELADSLVFLLDGRVRWAGSLDALLESTQAPTLERAIARLMQTPTDPQPSSQSAA